MIFVKAFQDNSDEHVHESDRNDEHKTDEKGSGYATSAPVRHTADIALIRALEQDRPLPGRIMHEVVPPLTCGAAKKGQHGDPKRLKICMRIQLILEFYCC